MLRVWYQFSRGSVRARLLCPTARIRRCLLQWRAFVRAVNQTRQALILHRCILLRSSLRLLRTNVRQAKTARLKMARLVLHVWSSTASKLRHRRLSRQQACQELLQLRATHALHRWQHWLLARQHIRRGALAHGRHLLLASARRGIRWWCLWTRRQRRVHELLNQRAWITMARVFQAWTQARLKRSKLKLVMAKLQGKRQQNLKQYTLTALAQNVVVSFVTYSLQMT